MSVELYRPGTTHVKNGIKCEAGIFNEYSFTHLLETGWFLTPEETCKLTEKDNGMWEYQLNDDVTEKEITEEELRAMAKEKGIRNWHNMTVDNLKVKLNDAKD